MSGHRIIGDDSFLFGEIINVDFLNESEEQMKENKLKNDFIYNVGETIIDENKNITIIGRYTVKSNNGYLKKMYQYRCNICGWNDGLSTEYALKKNKYCACCHGNVVVEGINDIPTTDPWMVNYFQGGYEEAKLYRHNSNKLIYPICPICKRIKNKPVHIQNIYKNRSIGCICGDGISFPEKYIFSLLSQLDIEFEYQYKINNKTNKRYDFYLPMYRMIIETHGLQHYEYANSGWNTEEKHKEILNNDENKMNFAINNGVVNYIIIDCRKSTGEYIQNSILHSKLFDIIGVNENKIDWDKCALDACRNLVIDVCNYYNSNMSISINDLARKFHISRTTVRKYLKSGNELNLCIYNKENIQRNSRKHIKYKEVMCINNSIIFNSAADAARYINHILNESGARNGISRVLNNKQSHYKGYYFKYVN